VFRFCSKFRRQVVFVIVDTLHVWLLLRRPGRNQRNAGVLAG